uniref:RRM domain-containing protein n=1 Tax=Araucaria cunninghamii TaxID=56994 RepID=A0A0D6QWX0_ARACU
MPNYSGTTSGLFSGMLGLISGILPGASGGAILPGLGASFGEVCRGYLNGQCGRNDCKFNHPPYNQLMAALAAGSTMGGLSQMPLAPSAAAMAAAQAIVAAQALQAHAAQAQAQAQSALESCGQKIQESGSPTSSDQDRIDVLSRTLEVSNLSPLLTSENLQQLFNCFGTVTKCEIAGCKQLAYVEYSKPEEARAALELNKMEVNGQSLAVEMAKSLPFKKEPSGAVATTGSSQHLPLPLMMQQAVAMQQLQFQQALIMQQSMASQQAANRAASMKSATEMASARAAEISKRLKADGDDNEEKASDRKSRSPSGLHVKSRSRSRSPIRYRRDRQSPSRTAVTRFQRDRRFISPLRSHRRDRSRSRDQIYHYRDGRDNYQKYPGRRDWGRSRDQYSRNLHRRSRSPSRTKKSPRARSNSPRHCKERRASPKLHKEGHKSSHHSRRSRSISNESRQYVKDNEGVIKNKGEYSGKLEEHVDKFTTKATDLHHHLEVKEDNSNDKPIKLESCRKITKPKEEISKDNVKDKDGRRNSKSGDKNNCTTSSFRDKDDCTHNVRVATKSDDMPKERKSTYDNEKDIKGKKRHTKGSIIVVDEDIVKKKLHKKEKRRYDDDYELKEKMLQYREKKAPDGKDEPKEKQQWRKESQIDPELEDAVKQHKKQRKKDEEDDNFAKKLEKNKHGKKRVYDSSDDSLLEYADRGDSPLKEISSQQKRKYGKFSTSVSPSHNHGD